MCKKYSISCFLNWSSFLPEDFIQLSNTLKTQNWKSNIFQSIPAVLNKFNSKSKEIHRNLLQKGLYKNNKYMKSMMTDEIFIKI